MLKIIFPLIAIVGLFLLIRSVLRLTKTFTANQQEFPATTAQTSLTFNTPGKYEVDVKRPDITGIISFNSKFKLTNQSSGQDIPVIPSNNIFAGRKDMSGTRIVPVAHFTIEQPGVYTFSNLSVNDFRDNDRIVVMPNAGMKGAMAVISTVFSGLLLLGGIVLSLLAFKGKI